ncbi:tRNA (adenosine(37)-N6)-threonylcarbamoyltransferase complex ATPase subunit type 1 TsaE [Arenicella xantha]|uniref:tRNA threonylcarbamoyladenosine biosynthesis protein TsaE n=1 Tax=Arenicella xantha TaxID=644221 RepID=A0A395JHM1_9GAMM|nr:tRNA (adenosine(37)-N6)-threonylcarbamoyltransferase complex ATPase subunit type 1 TsaE [Arenicella xantha]RBP49335.1 tRNA threonylcarbamoyladenosine biosynthesis protein TsaE [Arenicella xantha]
MQSLFESKNLENSEGLAQCQSLDDTEAAGRAIAAQLTFPSCVYLDGAMAAGKTTLAKSIIHGLGYVGDVTSPTYNLVQEYPVRGGTVYHMDLYRLEAPEELEFLALDDLWGEQSIFLVEWSERGVGWLPPATHRVEIELPLDAPSTYRNIVFKTGASLKT